MEENIIDLKDVLDALKKRWRLIVILTLVGTIISAGFSFFIIEPTYEAKIKLFIGKEEGTSEGYSNSDVQMYQNLLKTYSEVIKTKDLMENVIKTSKVDISPKEALENLTVETIANTQIIQIKYRSNTPEIGVDILQGVKVEFIKLAKDLVANGNIQVLEEPVFPDHPVSPNKKLNLALGMVLGLMIGIGIAFLLEFLDNTYKNKEQLEKELDIPVIGVIPNLPRD